mmetsp:Transcript_61975/g.139531  ORF Transcript_61975/g.139531 Transcript_61975/m.139531 type:complete len:82 (+) Transcript_61975:106-351(+)
MPKESTESGDASGNFVLTRRRPEGDPALGDLLDAGDPGEVCPEALERCVGFSLHSLTAWGCAPQHLLKRRLMSLTRVHFAR